MFAYGVSKSLPTVTPGQGVNFNSVQPSENLSQAPEQEASGGLYAYSIAQADGGQPKIVPPEIWDNIFDRFSFRDLLKVRLVSKKDINYAASFLLSNYDFLLRGGYISPNPPKSNLSTSPSEILKVRERNKLRNLFAWTEIYCGRVLSKQLANQERPSERIALLDGLGRLEIAYRRKYLGGQKVDVEAATRESLAAVQKLGLLNSVNYDDVSPEKLAHINYLTFAKSILEVIELDSKSLQFNLSAFLKVKPALLEGGMISALNKLDLRNLTDESVSKICELFSLLRPDSLLRPELTQENNNELKPSLEKQLQELGLNERNLNAIRDLVPMVQCGIFVNRIEEPIVLNPKYPDQKIRGITPLYYNIIMGGSLHKVSILIAAGADPNRQNAGTGDTPLHSKSLGSLPDIARILLKNGADYNFPNRMDNAPLAIFFQGFRPSEQNTVMSWLLDAGAEVDRQNKRGWTAMHYAIDFNDREAVTLLLNANADVDNLRNSADQTARELAKSQGRETISEIISNLRPLLPADINHTA